MRMIVSIVLINFALSVVRLCYYRSSLNMPFFDRPPPILDTSCFPAFGLIENASHQEIHISRESSISSQYVAKRINQSINQ